MLSGIFALDQYWWCQRKPFQQNEKKLFLICTNKEESWLREDEGEGTKHNLEKEKKKTLMTIFPSQQKSKNIILNFVFLSFKGHNQSRNRKSEFWAEKEFISLKQWPLYRS